MKPILFNTEMVRAIMDGRKTVTRRLVKFKPGQNPQWSGYIPDGPVLYGSNNVPAVKAPYNPGDILYVRETWHKDPDRYMYKASYSDTEKFYRAGKEVQMKWKPSIHMPKEAARIFLRVKAVRAERLQAITAPGAEEEGIKLIMTSNAGRYTIFDSIDCVTRFADLWDTTIKPADLIFYGWYANPWVWVIEFERCEKPEEE